MARVRALIPTTSIPNLISGLRLLAVIPVAWLLHTQHYGEALIVFTIAGASDGVDGLLAKRCGWTTTLGKYLDPLADKTLLVVTYVILGTEGLVPLWLVVLVIARDVIIMGGALTYRLVLQNLEIAPSRVSKVNTFLQIVLVLGVMLNQVYPSSYGALLIHLLILVTAVTTAVSGANYIVEWAHKACVQRRKMR